MEAKPFQSPPPRRLRMTRRTPLRTATTRARYEHSLGLSFEHIFRASNLAADLGYYGDSEDLVAIATELRRILEAHLKRDGRLRTTVGHGAYPNAQERLPLA